MHDPKLVAHDALAALPAAVRAQASIPETTLLLADEVLRYAAGTLPLAIPLEDRDGLVAMLCEDLEASQLLADLLAPIDDEDRKRRVLEIGTGWGFPGFVLSRIHPQAQVDVLEPDPRRAWFLRRLINLASVRNLRITVDSAEGLAAQKVAPYDLVLVKHAPVGDSVRWGAPFLRAGGALALWQGQNPGESGLQEAGREVRLSVRQPRVFRSAPLTGHVLLMARRPDEPKPLPAKSEATVEAAPVSPPASA